jgi:hypothetical protein
MAVACLPIRPLGASAVYKSDGPTFPVYLCGKSRGAGVLACQSWRRFAASFPLQRLAPGRCQNSQPRTAALHRSPVCLKIRVNWRNSRQTLCACRLRSVLNLWSSVVICGHLWLIPHSSRRHCARRHGPRLCPARRGISRSASGRQAGLSISDAVIPAKLLRLVCDTAAVRALSCGRWYSKARGSCVRAKAPSPLALCRRSP